MPRSIMLVPAGKSDGLFVASLGLVKALQDKGVKAALFRPLDACKNVCDKDCCYSLSKCEAVKYIAQNHQSELIEAILANYSRLLQDKTPDVVIVEGVVADKFNQNEINAAICHAVNADIVPVSMGHCKKAMDLVKIALSYFGNAAATRFVGGILLNDDAPRDAKGQKKLVLAGHKEACCKGTDDSCKNFAASHSAGACSISAGATGGACSIGGDGDSCGCGCSPLATIPYCCKNYTYRAGDLAAFIDGVCTGDSSVRSAKIVFDNAAADDRSLLLTATAPAETKAKIVIVCDHDGECSVNGAQATIATKSSVWAVAETLSNLPAILLNDDTERAENAAAYGAACFDAAALDQLSAPRDEAFPLLSPEAFRFKLTELARAANKRIALPEGDEPRTVRAAAKVAESHIAVPVLYGKKDHILSVAKELGVSLDSGVEFVDPDEIRENYVARLVELRKSKGLTEEQARELLQDNVFLATMMLERDEVNGLVSGAVHTTANTIRPALQVIKTAPGSKLVSAIFFMLMKEQVYVFGDCALNLNPDSDQLAQIAIQSADTAKAFGIDPRVAMVTYSTGKSGKGPDVDLMTEATKKAQELRPDLLIDGPLQYDAAVMPDVAAQKAPGSKVAGRATVFIFPSLSTGNTVYKAVQRSANVVAIGPMLQGLNKPVNDLSRGALVDDIVYTIAITAIQAGQKDQK